MANRYWVGGGSSTNWDATSPTNWSATDGGSNNASLPTDGDDVVMKSSANCVMSSSCPYLNSFDMTGYTGTLSGAQILRVGPSSGTTTCLLAGTVTDIRILLAPSGTAVVNFTSGGFTLTYVTITAASSATVNLRDSLTLSNNLTATSGTFNTNGYSVSVGDFSCNGSNTRTLNITNSTFTCWSWDTGTLSNLTFISAGSSVIVTGGTGRWLRCGLYQPTGLTFNNVTFTGNAVEIYGNNTFNTLTVNTAGLSTGLVFENGSTQTCTNFTTNGYASNLAKISSQTPGTPFTISKSSGTCSVNFMSIQDCIATGGATFNAHRSTNVSGNTGWTFVPYRTISNTGGNWDSTSTWVEGIVPTSTEDVIATSSSGQLTVNVASACLQIDLTGYTNTLTVTSNLSVYGSGVLAAGMTYAGTGNLYLLGSGSLSTLGKTLTNSYVFINTPTGGTFSLSSATTINGLFLVRGTGTFKTNGYSVTVGGVLADGGSPIVDFTNTAFTLTATMNAWSMTHATKTIPGMSLNFTCGAGLTTFALNGGTYDSITFANGTNVTSGTGGGATVTAFYLQNQSTTTYFGLSNAGITNLSISASSSNPSGTRLWLLTAATVQNLTANGSATKRLLIYGGNPSNPTSLVVNGTITASYLDFQNIAATGTANWNLSAITGLCGDYTGNTGITFTTPVTNYWVGNSGNWSDAANHWASSTGGTPGTGRIPLAQDTTTFDANSFSTTSQTVTVDCDVLGNVVSFAGVTRPPTITSSRTLYGLGSFTLVSGMTFSASLKFVGTGLKTFTSAGVSIGGSLLFNEYSAVTIADNLSCTGTLQPTTTTFTCTGKTVVCNSLDVNGGGSIDFTGSTITILGNTTYAIWSPSTHSITTTGVTLNLCSSNTGATTLYDSSGVTWPTVNFLQNLNASNSVILEGIKATNITVAAGQYLRLLNNMTMSSFSITGTTSKHVTIQSYNAGSRYTLTQTSGTNTWLFADIKDIGVTGGAAWKASNSTDVSNNSGFIWNNVRYWVGSGSTTNWDATGNTNWSDTDGGSNNASVPVAGDDVFFKSSSNCVVNANTAWIASIDMTGYTGTFSGASTLLVRAVTNNTNVIFNASTFSYTGSVGLATDSGTKIYVNTNGKTLQNLDFNWGSTQGGSYELLSAISVAGTLKVYQTLVTNNYNISCANFNSSVGTRTLTLGASTVTLTGTDDVWDLSGTGLTLDCGASTIVVSNISSSSKTFKGSGCTYNILTVSGDYVIVSGNNTFATLNINTAGLTNGVKISSGSTQIVTNFATNGYASNLAKLVSSLAGSYFTLSLSRPASVDYMSIKDCHVTQLYAFYAGANSTDVSGNANVYFTAPPTNRYWVGSGTWDTSSTAHWAYGSNGLGGAPVPAASNDVYFDANSAACSMIASAEIASLDCTGYTNTLTTSAVLKIAAGSLKFVSGMTLTETLYSSSIYLKGTGTITTGGKTIHSIFINGTYGLGDAYTSDYQFYVGYNIGYGTTGTLTTNNYTINAPYINLGGSTYTNTWNLGSSTINVTGGEAAFSSASVINAGTSTFNFPSGGTLDGAGKTYYNITMGSAGLSTTTNINGNNTFNNITVNGITDYTNTVASFYGGSTQTFSSLTATGSLHKNIFLQSSSAGTYYTLSCPNGFVSCDYLSIKDCHCTQTSKFYAGANSTDVSGNLNWIFTTVPTTRYWVGGGPSTDWHAATPTNWSTVDGGTGGAPIPTTNDVYFKSSANCAIATSVGFLGNLDMTGYTGTLSGSADIEIGERSSCTVKLGGTVTWTGTLYFRRMNTTLYGGGVTAACNITSYKPGTIQLGSAISCANIAFSNTFTSNGYAITTSGQCGFASTAHLGASTLNVGSFSMMNTTLDAGTSVISVTHAGDHFYGNDSTFNIVNLNAELGFLHGSNTFAELNLNNAGTISNGWLVIAGTTQTITKFTTNGSAGNLAKIRSYTPGTPFTLTSSNHQNIDYTSIQDSTVDVGKWFAGTHSTNVSGNTNWNFTVESPDRYLVSGTGVWDTTNRGVWASVSGGSPGATVPTTSNDVYLDANSPTTYSPSCSIGSLDCTGYINTLYQSGMFYINGSVFKLNATMGYVAAAVQFQSSGTTLLTTGGHSLRNVLIYGTGTVSQQDGLTNFANGLWVCSGTWTTNNYALTADEIVVFGNAAKTLNLGSSIVTINGNLWGTIVFDFYPGYTTIPTVNASSATILVTGGSGVFNGFGSTYGTVIISGDNTTISSSNTFTTLNANTAGLTNGLKFTAGTTQTVTNFTTNGSNSNAAKISSTSSGSPFTLSKPTGNVDVYYTSIKDSTATGGATWNALNSTNVSGNSGWSFAKAYTSTISVIVSPASAWIGSHNAGPGNLVISASPSSVSNKIKVYSGNEQITCTPCFTKSVQKNYSGAQNIQFSVSSLRELLKRYAGALSVNFLENSSYHQEKIYSSRLPLEVDLSSRVNKNAIYFGNESIALTPNSTKLVWKRYTGDQVIQLNPNSPKEVWKRYSGNVPLSFLESSVSRQEKVYRSSLPVEVDLGSRVNRTASYLGNEVISLLPNSPKSVFKLYSGNQVIQFAISSSQQQSRGYVGTLLVDLLTSATAHQTKVYGAGLTANIVLHSPYSPTNKYYGLFTINLNLHSPIQVNLSYFGENLVRLHPSNLSNVTKVAVTNLTLEEALHSVSVLNKSYGASLTVYLTPESLSSKGWGYGGNLPVDLAISALTQRIITAAGDIDITFVLESGSRVDRWHIPKVCLYGYTRKDPIELEGALPPELISQ